MNMPLRTAIAAILLAGPAYAGGLGYTVNITTTTYDVYGDRITEVVIDPAGTHTFPDPFTAPELSQQSSALATARTALGIPMGTTVNVEGTTPIDSDEVVDQVVNSNYNPVDDPDYVVGDPDDPYSWIAVGNSNVDVFVDVTTTHYTFHRLSADVAADCAAGSSSANGQEPCTPCSAGTYQPAIGQNSCLSCPAGSFSGAGASMCTPCDPGFFSAEGSSVCSACGAGYYSDAPGSSQCTPCDAGYFAAGIGSPSCTACGGGTYSSSGSAICTPCSAGTYSSGASGTCSPCSAGTFSSQGSSVCTPCSAGTFSSLMGQASCTDCGPGTFELSLGSTFCDPCPGGQATPCNGNGVCSDGPSGNGSCSCNAGYSGFACENGPPTTTMSTTTTTADTTTTTLPAGPCADLPQTGCIAATVSGLQIQTSQNKLKWKLGGGSLAVDQADLGDPSATTSWTLCIYDSTLDVPSLAGFVTVGPSASLWTSSDPKGWKYKDKAGSQSGVTGVALKTGAAGKPKAQLKAAGASLPLPPAFDASSFFDQSSTVTVQLVKDGGPGGDLCWTSEFEAADTKLNTPAKFKATAK